MPMGNAHNLANTLSSSFRSYLRRFLKVPGGHKRRPPGADPGDLGRIRHRQQIRIGMLYFTESLGPYNDPPQTLIVELIRNRSRGSSGKYRANRNKMIFLSHILMDGVIGKARERKPASREKHLYLVRRGKVANTIENRAGLCLRKHSEFCH